MAAGLLTIKPSSGKIEHIIDQDITERKKQWEDGDEGDLKEEMTGGENERKGRGISRGLNRATVHPCPSTLLGWYIFVPWDVLSEKKMLI